uniref:Uncharacterized protein n=1 Tax=Myoviridae sp. ctCo31 TaxID=2825053 RepID=A0A8S5UMJ2_9CAUD|nr:MAG TPA: hypothetical protein [Myoviridae sp. ctCo31]
MLLLIKIPFICSSVKNHLGQNAKLNMISARQCL